MARLSRILGPDGERVDLDKLFGEPQAGASAFGSRSPISQSPADGLNPLRLAQLLRNAATGNPRQYLELAEDIEEREPQYLTVLGTRRRQVAQLPVTVEAASDDSEHQRHAGLIREFLQEGLLDLALFDMLDAIGKGFSVSEIEWETLPDRIAPRQFLHRPARWFTFDRSDGETILLDGLMKEPLNPLKFVVHRHKAKSGLTVRGGLARPVAWTWMFKAFTARDWALFVQNYGQPMRVGKFSSAATDADKATLWRAVSQIAGDCAAIIPAGMEIEFIESDTPAGSSELFIKRVEYLDRMISKIVLGQTTTTDAVAGGHAVAQEHRLVQEDIERADAKILGATLTKQLSEPMVAFNFGPQARYPKIMIGRPDELPIGAFVDGVDKMVKAGLRVKATEVRNRLGITEPKAGDEVIGGAAKAAGDAVPAPAKVAAREDKPARPMLHQLISLHAASVSPEHIEKLTAEMARDAEGALAGLSDEVRAVFDSATTMTDLAMRLAALRLEPAPLAEAMQRGIALAHMAGGVALLEEVASARNRDDPGA